MSDNIHGRDCIIEFLRPYLDLSSSPAPATSTSRQPPAWRAIKRLMRNWGLDKVIIYLPSGRPSMSKTDFLLWWEQYKDGVRGK